MQSRIAVQFAIAFDVGVLRHKQVARQAHFAGRCALGQAVARMREEGHLGHDAKALHFLRRHVSDLGQLFGAGLFVDIGVGDEQRPLVAHDGVHSSVIGHASALAQNAVDAFQVGHVGACQAADHGVGIAQRNHERTNDGVGAAHSRFGHGRCGAIAFHELVVVLPVLAKAGVFFGVDVVHIHPQAHAQTGFFDASGNHIGAADEDRVGQFFIDGHLGGTQGALVLAVGIGHALGVLGNGFGGVEDGAHQQAGLRDKALQLLAVGVHVGDGPRGHTRIGSGLGHSGRDAQNQARVKRCGDQVVPAKRQLFARIGAGHFFADVGLGQIGDLAHAGQLHGLGDLGGATVQGAPKDVGEAKHVVDLVRVVRAACGNDAVWAGGLGQFGPDFGLGVGQGQDDRVAGHGFQHVHRHHAGGRAAQEHVGAVDRIGQRTGLGLLGVAGFGLVVTAGAAFVDHTLGVADKDVAGLHAQTHHHVEAGNGRSAGARHGQLDAADVFAHQLQAVEHGRRRDDGGAMLVVMKDRDVHALAQLLFNVEALGRLDVFEVDAPQSRLHGGNDLDQLVRVALGQFDVEHIDACKLLEQAALALHDGLGRQGANVAQTQYGRAVGDHGHQVATRGEFVRLGRIGSDVQAGISHTRRVGQRQIALVGQGLGRVDRNLAACGKAVVVTGSVAQGLFCGGKGIAHGCCLNQGKT